MGWLSGWQYRKAVTLSRSVGAVSDYQMKALIGESAGASGYDVHCEGHVLSSFNDLRFTKSDGTSLLEYWIESITGTTPNQLATVWIKFDYIGTGATTFYMYYGKSDASAYSNGDNTFLFFDHFGGTAIDENKWTINGTPIITVSGSIADIQSDHGATEGIFGKTGFSTSALRTRIKISTPYWCYGGFYSLTVSQYALYGILTSTTEGVESYNAGAETTPFSIDNALFALVDVLYLNNTSQEYIENGVSKAIHTTKKLTATDVAPRFYGWKGGVSNPRVYVDWVFIRQYLATEPSWGSWGEEEQPPPSEHISASISGGGSLLCFAIGFCLLFDYFKFGYLNNPYWTAEAAHVDKHLPCGYWFRQTPE